MKDYEMTRELIELRNKIEDLHGILMKQYNETYNNMKELAEARAKLEERVKELETREPKIVNNYFYSETSLGDEDVPAYIVGEDGVKRRIR